MKRPRYDQDYYERPVQKKRRYYTPKPRYPPKRQYIPRTLGPLAVSESKYYDAWLSNTVIVNTATSWAGTEVDPSPRNTLFVPTEGSDINNRIGRKVSLYKLAVNGIITPTGVSDAADVDSSGAIRVILFQDMQTNGVQAQGEELMQVSTSAELGVSAFQNPANFGRFRVLKDLILRPRLVTAVTDGTNTSSQNTSQIVFKMVVKFKKPVVVKFNATNAGTVGDIVDNSFHMLAMYSVPNPGITYSISYKSRGYYKDN